MVREAISTLTSLKQAKRMLEEMAMRAGMGLVDRNDRGPVYKDRDSARFYIVLKAPRQWQIIKEIAEEKAPDTQTTLDIKRHKDADGAQASFTFTVLLERDEDGFIVASCPALPGCHTQGRTRDETLANIREAIKGYIASMRRHGEEVPVEDVVQVEVAA